MLLGRRVAQLVVGRPAVWQAQVQIPALCPKGGFSLLSETSNEETGERPRRIDMNCAAYIGIGGMKIEGEPRH